MLLLSSRLYCRCRSFNGSCHLARGLYRRSGISPCPEDPVYFSSISLSLSWKIVKAFVPFSENWADPTKKPERRKRNLSLVWGLRKRLHSRCRSPHSHISSRMGIRDCPRWVRLYSTLGGIWGYSSRWTSWSASSSFRAALRLLYEMVPM